MNLPCSNPAAHRKEPSMKGINVAIVKQDDKGYCLLRISVNTSNAKDAINSTVTQFPVTVSAYSINPTAPVMFGVGYGCVICINPQTSI